MFTYFGGFTILSGVAESDSLFSRMAVLPAKARPLRRSVFNQFATPSVVGRLEVICRLPDP